MSADTPKPGWKAATLGSLGVFYRGRGGTKADARVIGIPCIRYGDLYTQHNDVIRVIAAFIAPERASAYTSLQAGDVVFAGSGETHEEIGRAAAFLGPEPAVVGADTIVFRPGSGLDPAYLGYAVNATQAARYKARLGQGSSVIHIGTGQLRELSLDKPPLPEQRRIAEILDTLDEAIRKTEQVIAKLQQMKQGLLHDLLTRGIDEHGELRDPERHPEQFKDSPLGRIPRGWEVSSAAAQFDITAGITLGAHRRPKHHPHPYLRVANVYRDRIDLSDVASLEARPNDLLGKTLACGDLLVVEGHANPDEIGRCAMATERVEGYTFQNHLFRLRPTQLSAGFALLWMNGASTRRYWWRMCSTSSGLNTINRSLLSAVPVAVLPVPEQERVLAFARGASSRIEQESEALRKLRTLKHGLMDDLLTGRVRVPIPGAADQ